MADNNNEVKNNNETLPDFGNVMRTLFDQVRTQTEAHRKKVRIQEKKEESEDSEDDEDDRSGHCDEDDFEQKYEILTVLAESHKLLCQAFTTLVKID